MVTLVLILLVVTTIVKMAFLAMNFVNCQWNWMGGTNRIYRQDIFCSFDEGDILQYFQDMKTRRGKL